MPATAYERPNDQITTSETSNVNTAEDSSSAESFFNVQRELIIQKQNVGKKENNTLSKFTSGLCITETDTKQKIMNHQQTVKSTKRPLNESAQDMCAKKKKKCGH